MPGSPGSAVQLPPKQWAYLANFFPDGCPGCWSRDKPGAAAQSEGGIDLFSDVGTPVFALGNGKVIAKGYNNVDGKGVLTIRTEVPGYGAEDMYYQHIDFNSMVNTAPGAIVTYGEQIGSVTDPNGRWSPHVEIGFNSGWGGPWGNNHPDQWYTNPRPLIAALISQHPNSTVVNPNGTPVGTDTGLNASAIAGSGCQPWDIKCMLAQAHDQLVSWGEHIALFLIALILIIIGFVLMGEKHAVQLAEKVKPI